MPSPAPRTSDASRDFVTTRKLDQTEVCVYERGTGRPLLLIHGQFGDHLDWEPVLQPLSERYRVIAPDLPGFGDSSKPDASYSAEFFTRHLKLLLDALGVDRAAVAGNS